MEGESEVLSPETKPRNLNRQVLFGEESMV